MEKSRSEDKLEQFIISAIDEWLGKAAEYQDLFSYYMGDDPKLRTMLRRLKSLNLDGVSIDLEPQLKITNNFAKKIISTISGRLWSNPVQVQGIELDKVLGKGFPKTAKRVQKLAGVYGVCHAFNDNGNVQIFEPTDYFPLVDEYNSKERAGIKFWRIADNKPWNVQLYEIDGFSWWIRDGTDGKSDTLTPYMFDDNGNPVPNVKRSYRRKSDVPPAGKKYEKNIVSENYPDFPIIPLHTNDERQTEFNKAVLSKIQATNLKETLYMDETLRNPFVAWYLQGYGGNVRDLDKLKKMFQAFSIIADRGEPGEGKITPMPIDIPCEEHEASMKRLEDGIYRDAQITAVRNMTGGSLTNVVIKAHMKEEDTKMHDVAANAKEWLRQLLFVVGVEVSVDDIRFEEATIINATEVNQDVTRLVDAQIITQEIGVKLSPTVVEAGLVEEALEAISKQGLKIPDEIMAALEAQQAGGAINDEGAEQPAKRT